MLLCKSSVSKGRHTQHLDVYDLKWHDIFSLPRTRLHIPWSLQKNVDLAKDFLFLWIAHYYSVSNMTMLNIIDYFLNILKSISSIFYTHRCKNIENNVQHRAFLLLVTDRFAPFLLFWYNTLNSLTWFIYFA